MKKLYFDIINELIYYGIKFNTTHYSSGYEITIFNMFKTYTITQSKNKEYALFEGIKGNKIVKITDFYYVLRILKKEGLLPQKNR